MTIRSETDLCVIGAGSAGLSVAAGAAQMGARVVLIEGHKMGGDCLNYGCVPSKSMLAAAGHAHAMTTGGPFGIVPVAPQIDFSAVKDHVDAVIAGIAPHDSVERFEGLGVDVILGHARFVSRSEVAVGDRAIAARRFVIATGSSPFVPPIPGLDTVSYHTNETIFGVRERPSHLVIIGGGPIGMEMAQAHARLGSRVTVIEASRALGKDDPELAEIALERLRAEGIVIVEGQGAENVRAAGDGIFVTVADGTSYEGSHLLVAVGRKANTDDLGLDVAGVETTRSGVKVDAALKTTNRRVYAIGDAAGGLQFTHVASYHAGLVVRSALFGLPAKAASSHIPLVTYTDPELASVGLTEAEARKAHGRNLEVVRFDYGDNDRARTGRHMTGRIKVMVVRGRPVGAGIVGAQAGELIGLWALAMSAKLKMSKIAGMVAPYPTLTEVSKRAAGQYYAARLFESATVKKVVRLVQKFR